ncbi:hypothetical protein DL96DRAFT_1614299 [Flagelloscypha sp. PMI_526]|nr:hypothetical protein DL96DRAFT_1614299 [Flagelloscypha sp. PMI_526]
MLSRLVFLKPTFKLTCTRYYASSTAHKMDSMTRRPRDEGDISSIFTTLDSEPTQGGQSALPERFRDLKQGLFRDELIQSWKEVVDELEVVTERVIETGSKIIPKFAYDEIKGGLSEQQAKTVKEVGSAIITGAVPPEEALAWKTSVQAYAAANKGRVKGFPQDNIQVFELYNTHAQIAARTHPNILNTQRILMSLWKGNSPEISLTTPISYFDRLRIRQPGDTNFTLGPHIDGGSVERWEDPGFRAFYGKILQGKWKEHDPFNADVRIEVVSDLYHTPNQCTIFRPFQGWTSLSTTGPGGGTLRLLPFLKLSSAYLLLRPFFRPSAANPTSLKDWELDLDSSSFPGAIIGKTQELNPQTHPHLRLEETMIPIPRVEPGDQVYWHCDTTHAVESVHGGTTDSSVFYIPAVPLTLKNADYLLDQKIAFTKGVPPPDFPGGEGESKNVYRASIEDVKTIEGKEALGFEPFSPNVVGEVLASKANAVLRL